MFFLGGKSIGSSEIGYNYKIDCNGHIHGIGAQEDVDPGKAPTQAQASDGGTSMPLLGISTFYSLKFLS